MLPGLLIRLVTGASWVDIEAILDHEVSDPTLRARRDEWIEAGVLETLKAEAMAAFDKVIELDLGDVAVDGSLLGATSSTKPVNSSSPLFPVQTPETRCVGIAGDGGPRRFSASVRVAVRHLGQTGARVYATARVAFDAWTEPAVAHSASTDLRDFYWSDEIADRTRSTSTSRWSRGDSPVRHARAAAVGRLGRRERWLLHAHDLAGHRVQGGPDRAGAAIGAR